MGIFTRRTTLEKAALAAQAAQIALGSASIQKYSSWIDAEFVDEIREERGGALEPLGSQKTRWYDADVERAVRLCDSGDLSLAGALWSACRSDGVMAGVLSSRTDGLVRLPRKFLGEQSFANELRRGEGSVRSVFDEMCPPQELALMAADGIGMGVSLGEMCPVIGRDYPVLVRHEPEWLRYLPHTNSWAYQTIAGLMPITPGDGRWVLHLPGGRVNPWRNGIWRAVGAAYIRKEHAQLYSSNWQSKLAHPARVAVAPNGATAEHEFSWFQKILAWGINTVLSAPPGYDVKLVESNGRGFESFEKTVDRSNREMIVAVSGQEVTVDGGSGFINGDLFKNIRADLIKATADALAYTANTQIIPGWLVSRFGLDALQTPVIVEWDVTPPQDLVQIASSLQVFGTAVQQVNNMLAQYGMHAGIETLAEKFNLVLKDGAFHVTNNQALNSPPSAAAAVGPLKGGLKLAS